LQITEMKRTKVFEYQKQPLKSIDYVQKGRVES
jgi:hypothetical protein